MMGLIQPAQRLFYKHSERWAFMEPLRSTTPWDGQIYYSLFVEQTDKIQKACITGQTLHNE